MFRAADPEDEMYGKGWGQPEEMEWGIGPCTQVPAQPCRDKPNAWAVARRNLNPGWFDHSFPQSVPLEASWHSASMCTQACQLLTGTSRKESEAGTHHLKTCKERKPLGHKRRLFLPRQQG